MFLSSRLSAGNLSEQCSSLSGASLGKGGWSRLGPLTAADCLLLTLVGGPRGAVAADGPPGSRSRTEGYGRAPPSFRFGSRAASSDGKGGGRMFTFARGSPFRGWSRRAATVGAPSAPDG